MAKLFSKILLLVLAFLAFPFLLQGTDVSPVKFASQKPITIIVHGNHKIAQRAEVATVAIEVHVNGLDKHPVHNAANEASTLVEELLAQHSPPNATMTTQPIGKSSGTKDHYEISHWHVENYHTGKGDGWPSRRDEPEKYYSQTSFSVDVVDLNFLGNLVGQVADIEHASISSIEWRLSANTTANLLSSLRQGAMNDAKKKAYDFAMYGAGIPPEDVKVVKVGNEEDERLYDPREVSTSGYVLSDDSDRARSFSFEPRIINVKQDVQVTFIGKR